MDIKCFGICRWDVVSFFRKHFFTLVSLNFELQSNLQILMQLSPVVLTRQFKNIAVFKEKNFLSFRQLFSKSTIFKRKTSFLGINLKRADFLN